MGFLNVVSCDSLSCNGRFCLCLHFDKTNTLCCKCLEFLTISSDSACAWLVYASLCL